MVITYAYVVRARVASGTGNGGGGSGPCEHGAARCWQVSPLLLLAHGDVREMQGCSSKMFDKVLGAGEECYVLVPEVAMGGLGLHLAQPARALLLLAGHEVVQNGSCGCCAHV